MGAFSGRRRVGVHLGVRAAPSLALAALAACVAVVAIFPGSDRVDALSVILGCSALIAGWLVAGEPDDISVSASFLVYVLAGVLLGPRSAVAVAVASELVAAARLRTRLRSVFLVNLPASVIPAAAAGLISRALIHAPGDRIGFYATSACAALVAITLSFVIWATLRRVFFPGLE